MFNLHRKFSWCLLIFSIILLNSCSSTHRDGPPSFYVDETKIPDAVPKVEPLSRIGNKPSYVVFGKRYYVMRSSKGYEEQGIASWYGTQFHTHHTSNGERYNMLAMTAAHKTLPLPTYLLVTNLKNGRKVIVKVNDRGPFEANRIIDLSYVAAKKLGMLGHGTTKVDLKAIDPREYNANQDLFLAKNTTTSYHPRVYQTTRLVYSSHHYNTTKYAYRNTPQARYLQVAIFRSHSHAEQFRKRISFLTTSPVRISLNHSLYVVKIGPFRNMAALENTSRRLRSAGLNSKRV